VTRRQLAIRSSLALAGTAGLVVCAVALGAVNPSATTRPSRLEKALAHAALDASVRARAPRGKTAPTDRESLERGRETYRANCLVCHGVPGGEQSAIAAGLNPPVPDLAEPETQARTDGELYFLVSGGVRLTGMPGFSRSLPETTLWAVVGFLRALPKLGDDELKALSAAR
jgi:mono/diheme cytochrome c family protein